MDWSRHIFGQTPALRHAWRWAVVVGLYSLTTALKPYPPFNQVPDLPLVIDAAMGVAMGWLIVLRTNKAYERWWEARTQWGKLVNISRNLAIKTEAFVADDRLKQSLTELVTAFPFVLKSHLRDEATYDIKLPQRIDDTWTDKTHRPSQLVKGVYENLQQAVSRGVLDRHSLWLLDQECREALEVCGACERIKTTLMSVSWRVMSRQCIALYLLVFPWGVVDDFGIWTIPLSTVLAYFICGAEGVASYVEEPFGHSEDHLDLDTICHNIRRSIEGIHLPNS